MSINRTIKITFITPCFCRGADCSDNATPEIRPASIRGQLRWWFRALGYSPDDESEIFGSVRKGARASKVVVRVRMLKSPTGTCPTLPHKDGGQSASKNAFKPGTQFELILSERYGGLSSSLEKKFNDALDAWLYMGTLGLRATRGAGSFTWEGQPMTCDDYDKRLQKFPKIGPYTAILCSYDNAESARIDISDTLKFDSQKDGTKQAKKNLDVGDAPLGRIRGGRKTSPLRFRVIQLKDVYYILAAWDSRTEVTGNTLQHIKNAIEILRLHPKEIGRQLHEAGCDEWS